jgi:hypothetical protein
MGAVRKAGSFCSFEKTLSAEGFLDLKAAPVLGRYWADKGDALAFYPLGNFINQHLTTKQPLPPWSALTLCIDPVLAVHPFELIDQCPGMSSLIFRFFPRSGALSL